MRNVLACALFLLAAAPQTFGEELKPGDGVVFLGDSITHHDSFVQWVALWYATRHPDLHVRVFNAGVGGDTAGGARFRLDDDVLSKKPKVVYVMFGANDIGWGSAWKDDPRAGERDAFRQTLFRCEANITNLVETIRGKAPDVRVVLMTAPPYDDAVRLSGRPLRDRDDAMAEVAGAVRRIAARYGLGLVDLHLAMSAFTRPVQAEDSSFTLSGGDRVHPGESDGLFILWCILRQAGESPFVSRVTIGAAKGDSFTENAELDGLKTSSNAVSFVLKEKALPFPLDRIDARVKDRLPFARDYNREILQVSGLLPGRYALSIDGTEVGTYDDLSLALGVNLSENPRTPQALQARKVLDASVRRHRSACFCRDWYWARYMRIKDGKDPDALEELRKNYRYGRYFEARSVGQYIEELANGFPSLKRLAEAEAEMARLAAPVPHSWSLVRVGDDDIVFRLTDRRLTNAAPVAVVSPNAAANGVALSSQLKTYPEGRFYDLTLKTLERAERPVTLACAFKVDGPLVWLPDVRRREPLAAGVRSETNATSCGAGGLSRWPFAAVTAGGKGIALGIDPNAPAYFRLEADADAHELRIVYDLGLSPWGRPAHVRFCRFEFDAALGFRGALEKYMAIFPGMFAVRTTDPGVWMPFSRISAIRDWQDFGFRFKEGDDETAWDDAHGILTFHYAEPCTWWMRLKNSPDGQPMTLEAGRKEAERLVAEGKDPMALAWATSAFKDENGQPIGRVLDTPWCKGVRWAVNTAPWLNGEMTDFGVKYPDKEVFERYRTFEPEGVDGEYVDSSEMKEDLLDFDSAHFKRLEFPLTFSEKTRRVGAFRGLIVHEYARRLCEITRSKGRFTMANGTPSQWPWMPADFDVMGTETDWNPSDAKTKSRPGWEPISDDLIMYRRVLCGAKPYCFLMNTDFAQWTKDKTERYMRYALAYGMLPGFFSADACTKTYFGSPDLYERDRPLFKKYVPLCRAVAAAGWRPVCRLASCDNAAVYVEQFGDGTGPAYVTVFNPTKAEQKAVLSVDTPDPAIKDLVDGGAYAVANGRTDLVLPPETVRLFKVR